MNWCCEFWGPALARTPAIAFNPWRKRPQGHALRQGADPEQAAAPLPIAVAGLCALLLLLVAAFGVRQLTAPGALPIREIKVAGQFQQLRPEVIRSLVQQAIDGGFFSVDVNAIRQRLLREPWVKQAAIQRIWPAGLQVTIVEQDPQARWGADSLLNGDGVVFRPAMITEQGMPQVRLSGPPGSETEVLAMYRAMSRLLVDLGVTVAALNLSQRGSWSAVTGDGKTLVLGRNAVEQRMRRLMAALRAGLAGDWPAIASVDLRYTNGFAVRRLTTTKIGGNA